MRLEAPSVLHLLCGQLLTTPQLPVQARRKRFVGGYEAGCSTLNGMESVMVSIDGGNNFMYLEHG